jgi:peptide/nickel transport system substrate-binding protein
LKRRLAHGFLACAIAALCVACGNAHDPHPGGGDEPAAPVRGGTLKVVGNSDVDHLWPGSAYVTGSMWLSEAFARQLVTYPPSHDYDAKIAIVADLAQELPTRANGGISEDGRVYTFHLRKGVRWNSSPPRAVTAHDFVRAFKLFCNPVSPVGAPRYYTTTIAGMAEYCTDFTRVPGTVAGIRQFIDSHDLSGVHAPDDSTLVFRLIAPVPDFLNLLAMTFTSAVPEEYLDYLPDSPQFRQHTLSNGPYAITRYVQGRQIELTRNPVWDPRTDPNRAAWVDRINIQLGIDNELAQLQVESGTADLTYDLAMLTANQSSLLAIGDPRVMLVPSGEHFASMHFLAINVIGPNNDGALRKLKVRQALALAVDRRAVAQLTGGPGISRPLYQAVSSATAGFRPGADRYTTPNDRGDPEAARRLLAEAGYPNGIRLRVAFPTDSTYPIEAQSAQASLRRAGFDVELFPYPSSDFWGRLLPNVENAQRGEWDLAYTGWIPDWYGANNGRSVIVPLYDGRQLGNMSQNYGRYDSAAVNSAIDRALAAPTADLAEAAWADAVAQIMDDVAIVPLIERKTGFMRSRRVRNCAWSVLGQQCILTAVWLADAAPAKPEGRP